MVTRISIHATIAFLSYGCAYDQHTRHSSMNHDSTLFNVSERPLKTSAMNHTDYECVCEIIRDTGNHFVILIFGFTIGALTAGAVAGVVILQIKLDEIRERQRTEDTILNIVEWNDLRRRVMRRMSENEINAEEKILNVPLKTADGDVENNLNQEQNEPN